MVLQYTQTLTNILLLMIHYILLLFKYILHHMYNLPCIHKCAIHSSIYIRNSVVNSKKRPMRIYSLCLIFVCLEINKLLMTDVTFVI